MKCSRAFFWVISTSFFFFIYSNYRRRGSNSSAVFKIAAFANREAKYNSHSSNKYMNNNIINIIIQITTNIAERS